MNETATILLVDDQERNLDALEAILSSTGYELIRARSADEALLALLKGDYAAIVCDICMPGIGGIELAQMIKQRKRTQHIPIVFLTAHMIEEDQLLRGYGVGAVDYLSKPINPEVLRLKLGVFVELFRKTRALAETNRALADEVTHRQRAQEELRLAKEELEQRVQERTAELIAANRALRESEDRMTLAMQGAAMGVFSHDLRSGKVLWSAAMESAFGLPPGGFEGTLDDFVRRVHEEDRQRIRDEMRAAARSRENFTLEFRFLRTEENGQLQPRWMSMVGRFVLNEEGQPVHSVAVATDVTARKAAADELRTLKDSAESANRAKDHFLAVLSHELRTPLTPVLATVQDMLRDPDLPEDLRERLDTIHRNVELEARLIDDLLDLTRIARGKMEIYRAKVDVHQVLEHALRTCEIDFHEKSIIVRLSKLAQKTQVMGDRARLLQIFWNLLKNAAKFTSQGQSVEIKTTDGPSNRLRIEVRDHGIGIDSIRLGKIFNAFEQGSSTVTRTYGGLGLGLSISKALVEMHGGSISVSSAGIGYGACFTIELPVEVGAAIPTGAPSGEIPITERIGPDRPVRSRRLLLIEDHPDTARVMQRLLRSAGYDVTTAGGVGEALDVCQSAPGPFEIVVSDLGLPDGSGLDFIRQFRVNHPAVPAIALSGFGMEGDRLRSLDAGFEAHITKPVDFSALQGIIEQVISQANRSHKHPGASAARSK